MLLEALAAGFYAYVVPAGLCLIMTGLGLSLSLKSLLDTVTRPRALIIGLCSQMVLLPALAFALAWSMSPPPIVAVGLVFLAACPGGITSAAYTFAGRGDVALSVTMTAISSLATAFTMPLYAQIALRRFGDGSSITVAFPLLEVMGSLFLMTVVPIATGILVRQRKPRLAERLTEPVRKAAIGILIVIIAGNAIASFDTIVEHFATAGVIALLLNLISMMSGFGIARAFGLPAPQVIAITYEVGVQNIALVFTISMTVLGMPDYAITALLYALVMKVSALTFLALSSRIAGRVGLVAKGDVPRPRVPAE